MFDFDLIIMPAQTEADTAPFVDAAKRAGTTAAVFSRQLDADDTARLAMAIRKDVAPRRPAGA